MRRSPATDTLPGGRSRFTSVSIFVSGISGAGQNSKRFSQRLKLIRSDSPAMVKAHLLVLGAIFGIPMPRNGFVKCAAIGRVRQEDFTDHEGLA